MARFSINLSDEVYEQLRVLAAEKGMTIEDVVREAVLKQSKPNEKHD